MIFLTQHFFQTKYLSTQETSIHTFKGQVNLVTLMRLGKKKGKKKPHKITFIYYTHIPVLVPPHSEGTCKLFSYHLSFDDTGDK